MTLYKMFVLGLVLLVHYVCGQYYSGNPYFNGYSNDYNAFYADQQRIRRLDIGSNPFLQHAINSREIDAGFMAPGYLPPVERQQLICSGSQVCVSKNVCRNGYFTQGSSGSRQDCDISNEVCCTYRPPPPPPPRPTPPQSTPCSGNHNACVPPNLCVNGVIKSNGFLKSQPSGKCYAPEVCCRIPEPESTVLTNDGYVVRVPEKPLPTPRPKVSTGYLPPKHQPPPPQRGEDQLSEPIFPNRIPNRNTLTETLPPSKCAAALNCTEIQYCTVTGMMSKSPVIVTKEQELFRVPLTDCTHPEKGFTGKCCRDPDYVDPWPVSQLGRYNAELFGDDGKYKPKRNSGRSSNLAQRSVKSGSAVLSLPIAPSRNQVGYSNAKPQPQGKCVTRNYNASPRGQGPYDAAFSEFPWQAMVLLESTKSLLCGGAIIGDQLILTAAHCVQGRKPFDVVIKGGEWKLGRDEEPKPFQLVRLKKIEFHPKYDSSSLTNDLALLHLDAKIQFDVHVGAICVDGTDPSPNQECVTTGWGKEALRLHAQDAIMHYSTVSVLPSGQCTRQTDGYHYEDNSVCGVPNVDACELDAGSALACKNSQGQFVLKGTYSAEDSCGNSIITFTKPDVQWINAAKGKRNVY